MANPELQEKIAISDPNVAKIKAYIDNMYNFRNSQGQMDFSVMRDYATMSIGSNWNLLNAFLLQEQNKLTELGCKLSEAKAAAYHDAKVGRGKRGYEVGATDMKYVIDGDPAVVKYTRDYFTQDNTVKYLARQLSTMEYFVSNVKSLTEIHRHVVEYGASAK